MSAAAEAPLTRSGHCTHRWCLVWVTSEHLGFNPGDLLLSFCFTVKVKLIHLVALRTSLLFNWSMRKCMTLDLRQFCTKRCCKGNSRYDANLLPENLRISMRVRLTAGVGVWVAAYRGCETRQRRKRCSRFGGYWYYGQTPTVLPYIALTEKPKLKTDNLRVNRGFRSEVSDRRGLKPARILEGVQR